MKKAFLRIVRSPWFWVVLAGYLLRIALMPLSGQNDVMFMPWMSRYVAQGHFNLYAFLYEKYGEIVMHRPGVWAAYPYGFYGLTAAWLWLLDKLGLVDLAGWEGVWQVVHSARMVFLFKLAYLPFDLGIIHYASDIPLSKGKNLGAGSLSYYGMDSTYAATLAILRRIMEVEDQRLASANRHSRNG